MLYFKAKMHVTNSISGVYPFIRLLDGVLHILVQIRQQSHSVSSNSLHSDGIYKKTCGINDFSSSCGL